VFDIVSHKFDNILFLEKAYLLKKSLFILS